MRSKADETFVNSRNINLSLAYFKAVFKGKVWCQQTKTYTKEFFTLNSFVNIAELKKVLLKAY